ncbi:hypothetical protein ACFE04_016367 [Oxalis oulophora]
MKTKSEILKQAFYILTINLLSLLLPLSVLLLSRFSSVYFFLSVSPTTSAVDINGSVIFSIFLPAVLFLVVSAISIATLINGFTGKTITTTLTNSDSKCPTTVISRPRLCVAWILLCTLQVSVGLGIEQSIAAGMFDDYAVTVGIGRSLISRTICFLGLHETMIYWSRMVVKPVVDDTIFQVPSPDKWVLRLGTAASFGCLWWWKLRDEIESLVIVPEAKIGISMEVGISDLIGWWLYYVTVTIGMVRIVKFVMWLGMIFLCRRLRRNNNNNNNNNVPEEAVQLSEVEDKV